MKHLYPFVWFLWLPLLVFILLVPNYAFGSGSSTSSVSKTETIEKRKDHQDQQKPNENLALSKQQIENEKVLRSMIKNMVHIASDGFKNGLESSMRSLFDKPMTGIVAAVSVLIGAVTMLAFYESPVSPLPVPPLPDPPVGRFPPEHPIWPPPGKGANGGYQRQPAGYQAKRSSAVQGYVAGQQDLATAAASNPMYPIMYRKPPMMVPAINGYQHVQHPNPMMMPYHLRQPTMMDYQNRIKHIESMLRRSISEQPQPQPASPTTNPTVIQA